MTDLVDRVRAALGDVPFVERRMFGGPAFLVGGNLAVTVREEGLLVRVPAAETAALRELPGVAPFEMRGRAVDGWVRVSAPLEDAVLEAWVDRGAACAGSLPVK